MNIKEDLKLLREYENDLVHTEVLESVDGDNYMMIEKNADNKEIEILDKFMNLVKVLEWYADKNHYNEDGIPYTNNSVFGITYDEGSIAREVLSKGKIMNGWILAKEGLEEYHYMDNVWGWSPGNDPIAWMQGGDSYLSYPLGFRSSEWDSSNQPTYVMLVGYYYPNEEAPEPPV